MNNGSDVVAGKRRVTELIRAGHFEEAQGLCTRICDAAQGDAEAWYLLGVIHNQLGHLEEAEASCRKALVLAPDYAGLHYNLGIVLFRQERIPEAVGSFEEGIRLQPENADIHDDLGNALQYLERYEEARGRHEEAIRLNPGKASAYFNMANACRMQERYDEAVRYYRRALERKRDFVEAYTGLGALLLTLNRYDELIEVLGEAVTVLPHAEDLLFKLGVAYQSQGNLQQALKYFQQVIDRNSDHVDALYGIGFINHHRGKLTDALGYIQHALNLQPDYAQVLALRAEVLKDQGKVAESIEDYRQVLQLQPGLAESHSNLLMILHYSGEVSPDEHSREHRRWGELHAGELPQTVNWPNSRDPGRRLRIGYVSPDFVTHSVSYFLEPLLLHRDSSVFETFAYADLKLNRPDDMTERHRTQVDQWRDITGQNTADVVSRIREDGIDILVDLAGHTAGNRLEVFARRAAPVQVTYLGYPNTTGLAEMDYRLTDEWADPAGVEELYTEQLVRLPGGFLCYRPPSGSPKVAELPQGRKGYVTFGSFNNLAKITPGVVSIWSEILGAVEGSRLLLKNRSLADAAVRECYRALFSKHGIERERVELNYWTPAVDEHLSLYGAIDIGLDTFPYNGTTTTCEALWMGVPVVTVKGVTHAGRVGNSILNRIGLRECIADDEPGFVRIAVELAQDAARLAQVRAGLREQVRASRLCDGERFCSELEVSYREMWRIWCKSHG